MRRRGSKAENDAVIGGIRRIGRSAALLHGVGAAVPAVACRGSPLEQIQRNIRSLGLRSAAVPHGVA